MKRFILCFIFLFFALTTSSCAPVTKEPISKSSIFFDTIISIQIYDSSDTKLLDGCFKICETYEQKLSRTIETSEISKINNASGMPVEVSNETIDVIKKGLYYSELSNGKFDITVAPLSILWDFKNNTGTIPDDASIKEALSHVNYKNIFISGNTITLKDPDSKIDLGAIAKGYIADKLKNYLKSEGVKHAIINLGGNVLAIGNKLDGTDFNIGIQKPFDELNTPITSVSIHDKSVVSSGIYERYFKKDGIIYHHILDISNGYPYQNNLLEVTIISGESVDGDGLSTTCFALGLDEGMELINSLDNTEAIFITDDYKLHYSNGLAKK